MGLGRAAVCDCGTPRTFLLPFFYRLVLDCRHLNKCLAKFKFKYEDVSVARQLFEKGTYLFSLDLRSAYHHISVWGPHRAFLGFCVEEDHSTNYYIFCALPFGLSTSGYIFQKIEYWCSTGELQDIWQ